MREKPLYKLKPLGWVTKSRSGRVIGRKQERAADLKLAEKNEIREWQPASSDMISILKSPIEHDAAIAQ